MCSGTTLSPTSLLAMIGQEILDPKNALFSLRVPVRKHAQVCFRKQLAVPGHLCLNKHRDC
jgi:hypothetical protein